MVIATGTEIGGLLVDGLGDGVLIEYPQHDLSFLRVMSFGLLQARKQVYNPCCGFRIQRVGLQGSTASPFCVSCRPALQVKHDQSSRVCISF